MRKGRRDDGAALRDAGRAYAPAPSSRARRTPTGHGLEASLERAALSLTDARAALLAWFRRGHRDLPWRRTREPYAIWLSEIMLQQTRVETVIPYWERFVARFPKVGDLAAADVADVLGLWSGLGYYARGRNLHRAAQVIARDHGGVFPRDEAALRALPGVGRYTAGAIASIAFDAPAPILDGNVVRVFSRLFAMPGDPRAAASQRALWELAARFADGPSPGFANQSLMELGATICTPSAPRCDACPAASLCTARARGEVPRYPETPSRKAPREVRALAALFERATSGDGAKAARANASALLLGAQADRDATEVLMIRRPPDGLLGGLWDLPSVELDGDGDGPEAERLARHLNEVLGAAARVGERVARVTHVFTHRRLHLDVHRCVLPPRARVKLAEDGPRWIRPRELSSLPLSRLAARALLAAGVPVPQDAAARGRRACV